MAAKTEIRVMIVDDHPLMREALRNTINMEDDMQIVGEAVNGHHAIDQIKTLHPDVVIMDLYMPVLDGLGAIRQLKFDQNPVKIIVLTSSNEDGKILEALQAGADGYILKDLPGKEVLRGIREVREGRCFLPGEVVNKMANALHASGRPATGPLLTGREHEVLSLLGQGLNNKEIAAALVISDATVRVHIYNLLEKLKMTDRRQIVQYASSLQSKTE